MRRLGTCLATAVVSGSALLTTAWAQGETDRASEPPGAEAALSVPAQTAPASSTEAQAEIKVLQRRLTRLENKIAYYKRVTVSFVTGRERIMDQLRRWRSRVIDRLPHAASSDRRLRLHERVVEYGENIRGQRARIHAKLQLRASQERALEAEMREITARIRSLEAAA